MGQSTLARGNDQRKNENELGMSEEEGGLHDWVIVIGGTDIGSGQIMQYIFGQETNKQTLGFI